MKKIVPLLLLVFFVNILCAQNFTGQWKGEFVDKSSAIQGWGGDHCEYVLEIECKGTEVSGYSYTYFSDAGKKYYTICKLTGRVDKAKKYIELKEVERTKTNVPMTIRNCFQIHRLTYSQEGNDQKLEGSWVPVPDQNGDCGFGTTVLSKRLLQKNPEYYNNTNLARNTPKKTTPTVSRPETKRPPVSAPVAKSTPKITTPPVVKTQPKKTVTTPPVVKVEQKKTPVTPAAKATVPEKKPAEPVLAEVKKQSVITDNQPAPAPIARTEIVEKKLGTGYERRNTDILKTIEIDNNTFTVDLYDNGDIDGDSISLFYNGKLLLSHKRLSDKAIRLTLNVEEGRELNELIMYAENLGTIPPNTALMVVNDGDNRYEVRISSDLQKSGVIRFKHKPKIKQ